MTDETAVALARTMALLESLQQQVGNIERRLQLEFVSAREVTDVRSLLVDLREVIRELKKDLEKKHEDLSEDIERNYVTQTEFRPVMQLVYGVVTLILVAVVGAIVALVVR